MRTTLNIDDAALAAALDLAPGKTKTAVINDALRDYTRGQRLRGLRLFAGKVRWEGNLDALRKRPSLARGETRLHPSLHERRRHIR